jgi:hypothetical protein
MSIDRSLRASVPLENVFEIERSETSGLPGRVAGCSAFSEAAGRAMAVGTRVRSFVALPTTGGGFRAPPDSDG